MWLLSSSPVLIAALALVVALCLRRNARRPANSFPTITSWIPFFGASFAFRHGPVRQLQAYTAAFGPVFNLTLLGRVVTYVTDAAFFPALMKCPALGLFPLKVRIYERVFGAPPPPVHDPTLFEFLAKHTRHNVLGNLSGASLAAWTAKSHALFRASIHRDVSTTPTAVAVYPWLAPRVFATLVETFYGPGELTSVAFAADYDQIEAKFAALYAGAPASWIRVAAPRQRVLDTLRSHVRDHLAHVAPIVRERWLFCHDKQVDQAAYQLAFLWAMTSNAMRTLFWVLYHLQQTPEAWAAVAAQVQTHVQDTAAAHLHEALQHCDLLDSAIKEALRVAFGNTVIRVAVDDAVVDLPDGSKLAVAPGDEIMLTAGVAYHDPTTFSNPMAFEYDRFVRSPELAKEFRPFGIGKFNCPGMFFDFLGQYFAMDFLKAAMATLILETDILDFQGTTTPNYTTAGVYAPKDSLAARMTIRLKAPKAVVA
ncbi:Aste57867_6922 [Aphanomyces stellatus]|uniref:Aste57867_6922 protein n=1 Tax=Aphanomyces stellatus TaxID=120398 RepID=A0A485KHY5_9STRA|nr:hypothetical protein As57867_006900 [Aphanomyces stellatus]VFT83874.1 Aste57867_6922 [Aphanomyces stellatus]